MVDLVVWVSICLCMGIWIVLIMVIYFYVCSIYVGL